MAKIELKNLKIIEGEDKLSSYKFGKKEHDEHFFCSICGIYTHHRSFTNPENYEFYFDILNLAKDLNANDAYINDIRKAGFNAMNKQND